MQIFLQASVYYVGQIFYYDTSKSKKVFLQQIFFLIFNSPCIKKIARLVKTKVFLNLPHSSAFLLLLCGDKYKNLKFDMQAKHG